MYDIITVGSATLDVFVKTERGTTREHNVCYPIGGKLLIRDLHFATGGAGTNTAVAFSRLGLKTAWLGMRGTDPNTIHIEQELKKENVNLLGPRKKGNTGYSVILTGLNHDRTILTYKGLNDTLTTHDFSLKQLQPRGFYFGSMMGMSYTTLKKIAQHAKKNNIPYTFNPSTYLAKKGLGHLKQIIKECTLLVLNKEEAQLLTKKKILPDILAMLRKYARFVIITDGKKGAYGTDGKQQLHVHPRPIRVIDPTGAGDAFAAGATYGLYKKMSFADTLRAGQAEAESILTTIGAKNNLLSKKQLYHTMKKIKVTPC